MPILHLTREFRDRAQAVSIKGFAIRNIRLPGDVAPWLSLRGAAFEDVRPRPGRWTPGDFDRELCRHRALESVQTWVAEPTEPAEMTEMTENERNPGRILAGSVSLRTWTRDGRQTARVHWLLVHPRFRRCGLGAGLMATLENACWDAGIRQISLETHRDWTAAVAFYRRLGYS